jgi:hypothetical protein
MYIMNFSLNFHDEVETKIPQMPRHLRNFDLDR